MGNCIGQSENPEKLVAQCINQIESVCNDTEADQTKKAQVLFHKNKTRTLQTCQRQSYK